MTAATTYTDVGNAAAFVEIARERLRFVGGWSKWLAWDGARWALDQTGAATELAKLTAREMFAAAAEELREATRNFERAMEVGDKELAALHRERMAEPKARYTWALRSHDAPRISAMVKLAQSSPELAVTYDQLDANPWLLNVRNGTVDLRTGNIREHRRGDLITKVSPVAYDAHAMCPSWEAFLAHAQNGNTEMLEFIQRAMGYALTGAIRDHVLLFLYGPAGTGKSTFFRIAHAMLGEYAVRAPRSLLFQSRGERHPTELATLHGARFVSCNEIDEGATFDEALVKDLTGGEAVSARRMREDFWTFTPTHKLAIGGNYKPRVRNFDDAIRRRVRLIPWMVKPATVDTQLFDKLVAELPGILAWAVRGCLAWQRDGLGEPLAVKEATDEYQGESDPLGEFFDLHCVFGSEERVPRAMLRSAYEEYCKENGAPPLPHRPFAAGLKRRGVTDGSTRHMGKPVNGWKGVRLATDAERERRHIASTHTPIIETYARTHTHEGEPAVGTCEVPTAVEPWPGVVQ